MTETEIAINGFEIPAGSIIIPNIWQVIRRVQICISLINHLGVFYMTRTCIQSPLSSLPSAGLMRTGNFSTWCEGHCTLINWHLVLAVGTCLVLDRYASKLLSAFAPEDI